MIRLNLQNVNLPQIIEHQTPDFFHTLTVALAPVVLHPLQYGVGNLSLKWSIPSPGPRTILRFISER